MTNTSLKELSEAIESSISREAPSNIKTKQEITLEESNFWASESGVTNSEVSDLMSILNQYK